MNRPQHQRRSLFTPWRWPRWVLVVLLLMMLLAYPLSIGPVRWLAASGYLPSVAKPIVEMMYAPIFYGFYKYSDIEVLDAYLEWWTPKKTNSSRNR